MTHLADRDSAVATGLATLGGRTGFEVRGERCFVLRFGWLLRSRTANWVKSREGGLRTAFGGTRLSLSLEPSAGERGAVGEAASSTGNAWRGARW